MANTSTKIIVKVGKKSQIRFSHSKVFRAILAEELYTLSSFNSDCNIVVIENIKEEEQQQVKGFIEDFIAKNDKNTVLFFIPDNDDITAGIADELDYNIYLTLNDLYKTINEMFNINLSIYSVDKKKYNLVQVEDSLPDGITDIFDSLTEEEFTEQAEDVSDVKEQAEVEETRQEVVDTVSIDSNNNDSITAELKDLKYEYSLILKDMKEANGRIISLEEIITTLKSEKQAIIDRFNELIKQDEVLEDPISLDKYESIISQLSNKEIEIKELTDNVSKLKNKEIIQKEELDNSLSLINEYKDKIDNLQQELNTLNSTIESGEIHKEVLSELQSMLNTSNSKNKELQETVNNIQQDIEELSIKNSLEANTRILYSEFTQYAFFKLKNLSDELENSITESNILSKQIKELSEKVNIYTTADEKHKETIITLETELDEKNKRLQLAENYYNTEISSLKNSLSNEQNKLKSVEEELNRKQLQYNELIAKSGIDATSTQALLQTNNTLEQVNATLREKLNVTSRELDEARKSKIEIGNLLNQQKSQIKQLSDTLKVVASSNGSMGLDNGVLNFASMIKGIQYDNQAQIIPVFGSGSFGITTTAMSLAYKLCNTQKVLYIDFDLVAPKADAWFSKLPLCKNVPGININDMRMTGLGILYELGMSTFTTYFDNIINTCDRTKDGGVDYLSGAYYRVDNMKLVNADYSSFFNFLASKYTYIVIDMGRLGSSDVNDSIIKVISDIATRNVVVTTSDRFEVRNFKMKLLENKINVNNIAWLINMCESTNIDAKVKQSISPSQFGIMLNDTELHGVRERFTRNKLNKDKLDLFINYALFANRK